MCWFPSDHSSVVATSMGLQFVAGRKVTLEGELVVRHRVQRWRGRQKDEVYDEVTSELRKVRSGEGVSSSSRSRLRDATPGNIRLSLLFVCN